MDVIDHLKKVTRNRITSSINGSEAALDEAKRDIARLQSRLNDGTITPEKAVNEFAQLARKLDSYMALQLQSQVSSLVDLAECLQIEPEKPSSPFVPVKPELLEKSDKPKATPEPTGGKLLKKTGDMPVKKD